MFLRDYTYQKHWYASTNITSTGEHLSKTSFSSFKYFEWSFSQRNVVKVKWHLNVDHLSGFAVEKKKLNLQIIHSFLAISLKSSQSRY